MTGKSSVFSFVLVLITASSVGGCFPFYEAHQAYPMAVVTTSVAAPAHHATPVVMPREVTPAGTTANPAAAGQGQAVTMPPSEAQRLGRQEELAAEQLVRRGDDLAVCDATIHLAQARRYYQRSGDPNLIHRGDELVRRFAPACAQRIERFWSTYQGCVTPIRGAEVHTFVYWDQSRATAFRQLGLPGLSMAIIRGRSRWQGSCPTDFAAVLAVIPSLFERVAMPGSAGAAAASEAPTPAVEDEESNTPPAVLGPDDALALMARSDHEEALSILEQLAERETSPVVLFNLAVCHDRLGNRQQALTSYRMLEGDNDFGPYSRARSAQLAGQSTAEADQENTALARQEYLRGMELFENQRHAEAIAAFQQAYDLVHHPRVLFNLAVCYQQIGQRLIAASFYHLVVHDTMLDEEVREQGREVLLQLVDAESSGGAPRAVESNGGPGPAVSDPEG